MSIKRTIVSMLFVLTGCTLGQAQVNTSLKRFVYTIRVTRADPTKATTLTGFRLKGTSGIVTCLHGVLGSTTIAASNRYPGRPVFQNLTLAMVDTSHDLAILTSTETSGSADGLDQGVGMVLPGTPLRILGHPGGIDDYDHPGLASAPAEKTLEQLAPDGSRKRLNIRNSPSLSIKVLGLDAGLAPGDSGAPVFTKDDKVIAVADGGLMNGAASISWAMPLRDIIWAPVTSTVAHDELTRLKDIPSNNLYSYNIVDESDVLADQLTADVLFRSLRKNIDAKERRVKVFWKFNQWVIWFAIPPEQQAKIAAVSYTIDGLEETEDAWVTGIGLYGWNGTDCTKYSTATVYLNTGQAPFVIPFNLCTVPSADLPPEASGTPADHT